MVIIKTRSDLKQLPPGHPAMHILRGILDGIGPECGYVVLLEPGEESIDLPEVKGRLADIPWEGAIKVAGYFHAVHLTNNQFGISCLIPDSVRDEIRAVLVALL